MHFSHLFLTLAALLGGAPASVHAQTILVRRAPEINGWVEGSIQAMTAENVALGARAVLTGDLRLPGSPEVRVERRAWLGETISGGGSAASAPYRVTLNGGASLARLVLQTDPVGIGTVEVPRRPPGRRDVELNQRHATPGEFSTLRNLKLSPTAGMVAIPPGAYGNFAAHGGSGFVVGDAGSSGEKRYDFQDLALDGGAALWVRGPVVITVRETLTAGRSRLGDPSHPEWLRLRVANGGLVLNGGSEFHGYVEAPAGLVALHGEAVLTGGISSARLSVAGAARVRVLALPEEPATPLPHATSFETGQGFHPGPVQGQGGWQVPVGAAEVSPLAAFDGTQGLQLNAGAPAAVAELHLADGGGSSAPPIFIEFHARPAVGSTPEEGSIYEFGGIEIGFVREGESVVPTVRRPGVEAGHRWWPAPARLALDPAGALRWVRLTLRVDRAAGIGDVSVDGRLVLFDLPLVDGPGPALRFRVRGAAAVSHLDFLYAGFDNPLHADADRDGLEDAWELVHGLDPGVNDRQGDPDGDGLSNVREFGLGTSPEDFFDGVEPLTVALHGGAPGPDDELAIQVRRPDGTPWANAPVTFRVAAGQRRIAARRGDPPVLAAEARSDSSGVARVYLEPLAP